MQSFSGSASGPPAGYAPVPAHETLQGSGPEGTALGDSAATRPPRSITSSGSDTLAEGRPHDQPGGRSEEFHDAPEDGATHPVSALAGAGAAASNPATTARQPHSGGYRPTSYMFEDPDAMHHSAAIPEMIKLTSDVPAKEQISIILGPFVIIFCDLVIPVIVYYSWLSANPLEPGYDEEIMGYAVIAFGLGELYILVVRVWRLIKYREDCAPLLSKHRWELDATSWIYGAGLIAGLIPFVVGSALEIPELYLYSPGIYMAFIWFFAFISLFPFKVPVQINSEPRWHRMRPLVYYAAEDFFAVDGWQGRDFRRRYRERYENSIMFRKMILEITLWWNSGFMVYIGCLSAVIFNNPFHVAFGLSLGLLFGWIITWAVCTYVYVQIALEREREWWIKQRSQREKIAV